MGPLLPSGPAQGAESLGITPPNIEVVGAQRGQAYERSVVVQNQFDSPTVLTLEPLGAVGSWTTTAPGSGHEVPPRSQERLVLTIAVPGDAPNGLHSGFLRVVAEPKGQPQGSGFALRYAVAVVLNVTVGGEALIKLRGLDARAEDVEVGTPPVVYATLANEGNVRAPARATVEVLDAATSAPVAGAAATGDVAEVRPGQQVEVPMTLPQALPEGPYLARVRSPDDPAFERIVEFRVVPRGLLGKRGELRALEHEPWVEAGRPLKVACLFANTGSGPISAAKCSGELRLDGRLVAVFTSDALVVPAGQVASLVAYVTPDRPGAHTLVASVTFDGLTSRPNESVLNVQGDPSGGAAGGMALGSWPLLAGLALALVGGGLLLAGILRRRKRGDGKPPS